MGKLLFALRTWRRQLRNSLGSARAFACWFESLVVASHPLQRRHAETIFSKAAIGR
jgi:hypothetical protein